MAREKFQTLTEQMFYILLCLQRECCGADVMERVTTMTNGRGVIGPGTGTFMILAYTSFIGYDYVTASGNAKVANLASNLASLIVYLLHGNVLFLLAVPAGICGILGGWIGSSLAISKGTKFIKVIVVLVLIGVFGKLIWDVVSAAGVV